MLSEERDYLGIECPIFQKICWGRGKIKDATEFARVCIPYAEVDVYGDFDQVLKNLLSGVTCLHIRPGAVPDFYHLHDQVRVTNPPSHHRCIKYNRLHKPVPRTPKRLILIRLLHTSGRISAAVNRNACFITVILDLLKMEE